MVELNTDKESQALQVTLVALSASAFFRYVMTVSQISQVSLLPTLRATGFSIAERSKQDPIWRTQLQSHISNIQPCSVALSS